MIKQSDVAQIQPHIGKPFHWRHNEYVGLLFNNQKFDDYLDKGIEKEQLSPQQIS